MKKLSLLIAILVITLISCNNDDDSSINEAYPDSLIAYFPFKGNALNEIPTTNDGIVDGAVLTTDMQAIENSAYLFNGIDNMIRVPHNDALNLSTEFTITALVRPQEVKTQHVIRKGPTVNGPGTWPYGLAFSQSGDIIFTVTTENGSVINQARKQGYEANQWYYITGVYKNNTMYLYVNGMLEATENTNGLITTNTYPLLIGTRLSMPSNTFKGTIDEIRIYNTALSETEITTLYNNL